MSTQSPRVPRRGPARPAGGATPHQVNITRLKAPRHPCDHFRDVGAKDAFLFPAGASIPAHYGAANDQHVFRHDADGAQWHTMAMDWRPDAIRFYRDGAPAGTLTDASAIADVAHLLCIQLDAMATRQLTAPVRMFVDYVRIYE